MEPNIFSHQVPERGPLVGPLITFAVFAYNQERYISEAVLGAFAQVYSPLEIILSDDCSPDGTFEIMKAMAASYCGPHKIILNKMPYNSGLASHINHVMSMATGELVVVAGGDDISLPERVERNVDFYLSEGRPDSIFSDYLDIDEGGNLFAERVESPPEEQPIEKFIISPRIKGAAHAWSMRVFREYGPLIESTLAEDQVIPFRAYLLSKPRYLPLKLVRYRRTARVITTQQFWLTYFARIRSSMVSYIKDLGKHSDRYHELLSVIQKRYAWADINWLFWQSSPTRISVYFPGLIKNVGIGKATLSLLQKIVSIWIPSYHSQDAQ